MKYEKSENEKRLKWNENFGKYACIQYGKWMFIISDLAVYPSSSQPASQQASYTITITNGLLGTGQIASWAMIFQ